MATAYTPGPWSFADTGGYASRVGHYREISIGGRIVKIPGNGQAEADANAHIVAVAPKLLEVLKEAYARFSAFGNNWPGRETTEGQWLLANMFHTIQKAEGKQ